MTLEVIGPGFGRTGTMSRMRSTTSDADLVITWRKSSRTPSRFHTGRRSRRRSQSTGALYSAVIDLRSTGRARMFGGSSSSPTRSQGRADGASGSDLVGQLFQDDRQVDRDLSRDGTAPACSRHVGRLDSIGRAGDLRRQVRHPRYGACGVPSPQRGGSSYRSAGAAPGVRRRRGLGAALPLPRKTGPEHFIPS
jgi:hypothetical protein